MELRLTPVAASVSHARRAAADIAREHGGSDQTARLTELLTSEIATNAVKYGSVQGVVLVSITCTDGVLTVSVRDDNLVPPVVRHAEPEDTGGRGMDLVEQLALAWGVEIEGDGKRVWFQLALR